MAGQVSFFLQNMRTWLQNASGALATKVNTEVENTKREEQTKAELEIQANERARNDANRLDALVALSHRARVASATATPYFDQLRANPDTESIAKRIEALTLDPRGLMNADMAEKFAKRIIEEGMPRAQVDGVLDDFSRKYDEWVTDRGLKKPKGVEDPWNTLLPPSTQAASGQAEGAAAATSGLIKDRVFELLSDKFPDEPSKAWLKEALSTYNDEELARIYPGLQDLRGEEAVAYLLASRLPFEPDADDFDYILSLVRNMQSTGGDKGSVTDYSNIERAVVAYGENKQKSGILRENCAQVASQASSKDYLKVRTSGDGSEIQKAWQGVFDQTGRMEELGILDPDTAEAFRRYLLLNYETPQDAEKMASQVALWDGQTRQVVGFWDQMTSTYPDTSITVEALLTQVGQAQGPDVQQQWASVASILDNLERNGVLSSSDKSSYAQFLFRATPDEAIAHMQSYAQGAEAKKNLQAFVTHLSNYAGPATASSSDVKVAFDTWQAQQGVVIKMQETAQAYDPSKPGNVFRSSKVLGTQLTTQQREAGNPLAVLKAGVEKAGAIPGAVGKIATDFGSAFSGFSQGFNAIQKVVGGDPAEFGNLMEALKKGLPQPKQDQPNQPKPEKQQKESMFASLMKESLQAQMQKMNESLASNSSNGQNQNGERGSRRGSESRTVGSYREEMEKKLIRGLV